MTPISAAIGSLADRFLEYRSLLISWCDQNSGSDHPAGLAAMLARLEAAFGELPGTVERVRLKGTTAEALRVRVRPAAPLQLCLSGHFDTVYSAEHPFQRCTLVDPATLRGPGVADMKGGLVAMLAALHALEQTPEASALGYEIVLSPDEEIGTPGTAAVLAEAAPRHHFGLIFEPARTDGSIVRTRKGVGALTVVCRGRAAHAAIAEEGRNAIAALAEFLVGAHRVPSELPGILLNIGQIRGGGSATNIVPNYAEAKLDVRTTEPGDERRLLERLDVLAAPIRAREGFQLEFERKPGRPPKGTGAAETVAFAGLQRAAADLGQPPFTWVDSSGGSDGNLLYAAGLPNLDGMGPIGDFLHSDREYVDLPSLIAHAQRAALFMHRLATGEIQLPPRTLPSPLTPGST